MKLNIEKPIEKINETKNRWFEKINKIKKPVQRRTKIKRKKTNDQA